MNRKQDLLDRLRDEFQRWEDLLAGLSEEQITVRNLPSGLSIKDVVAHLWAWQQRSNARLEAALHGHTPQLPGWPPGLDPDLEQNLEAINAWIHTSNRDKPWSRVYQEWRLGFLHLIETSALIPEEALFETGRYPWLPNYPLAAVLEGTYNHHQEEHYEPLSAWLNEHGHRRTPGDESPG